MTVVRIPAKGSRRPTRFTTYKLRYPWDEMELGDFFEVPAFLRSQGTLSASAATRARNRPGLAYYTSTLVNAEGFQVVRVTRVPPGSLLARGRGK